MSFYLCEQDLTRIARAIKYAMQQAIEDLEDISIDPVLDADYLDAAQLAIDAYLHDQWDA